MIEKCGNIWEDRDPNRDWVVVTTNSSIRQDGTAVMGRGIAEEAKELYPNLPRELGNKLKSGENEVYVFPQYGIITFPTKHQFHLASDLKLIENSCKTLANLFHALSIRGNILMPRPGCGYGKLKWGQVKPICARYLVSDQFIIYHR